MARYYRRRRFRRRRSKPSAVSSITKPFRAPFQMMGIKSPITQTLLSTPIVLAALYKWMPDTYDTVTDLPETIADKFEEITGV